MIRNREKVETGRGNRGAESRRKGRTGRVSERRAGRKIRATRLLQAPLSIVIIFGIAGMFYVPTRVMGTSMEPAFTEGEYLLVNKNAYRNRLPRYGDVIVFRSELQDDAGRTKQLIKRIIGLPGQQVDIADGKVYVDGKEVSQEYAKDGITNGAISVVVPEESYFVLGDNRLSSGDSREAGIGCVPRKAIQGKVIYRLFPWKKVEVK